MAAKAKFLREFVQLSERAYNNVYTAFKQIAFLERASMSPAIADQAFVASIAQGQTNSVEVKGALRIDRLPYRRKENVGSRDDDLRHGGGINILMDSIDIYKFDLNQPKLENSFLYKSQVRIAYFKSSKAKWKPHLCIRYDFARSYGSHPIFHAQLENGIPDDAVREMFPNLPEVIEPLDLHFKVRLPTANVVGATALLSLAADHLPMTRFPDVLRAVRGQTLFKIDPWRCDCSSLDGGLAPQSMLASQWYSTNLTESP